MENPRFKQLVSERRLTVIYFVCAALSTIGLITTAVVFGYWHDTLNICQGQEELGYRHCGCLLYAKSTFRLFIGGDTVICHFVEYSNVPGIVIGLTLGVWHWYRTSFILNKIPKSKRKRRPIARNNDNEMDNNVAVVQKPSTYATVTWLFCAFILLLTALMCLTSAILLTDGAMKACGEYRQNIVETIHADSNMAVLIKDRLFCNAVFDFMDYLQPIKYRFSANFINSGAAIYVALFTMWFAALGWVSSTIICMYEAFRFFGCCCRR